MRKKVRGIYKKLIGLSALCVGLLAGTVTTSGADSAAVALAASLELNDTAVPYAYRTTTIGAQIVQLKGYEINQITGDVKSIFAYKSGNVTDTVNGIFYASSGYKYSKRYNGELLRVIGNTNGLTLATVYLN